jgi:hypothetical protein
MSDLNADKQSLSEYIGAFAARHGKEEVAKLLSRALLGLAYQIGATEAEFTDEVGAVRVTCTPISPEAKQ